MEEPRDAARVRVFPPGVPLLTILLGVGLDRLWPLDLWFGFSARACFWMGGAIVVAAILGLGLHSVILVRRSGQSENPMMLRNTWILLLVPLCAWVLHRFAILPEEAYLQRKFGEKYLSYKRRVRRWI